MVKSRAFIMADFGSYAPKLDEYYPAAFDEDDEYEEEDEEEDEDDD